MANLYNSNNDQEGFQPKPDITQVKSKSSIGAVIWYFMWIFIIPIFLHVSWRNNFLKKQNKINELASGIDVQLKKRRDTLIKLFETTKGYAEHEKEVMKGVAQLRNLQFNSSKDSVQADITTNSMFSRLLAISENYPQLKADTHFAKLMEKIDYLEREIAASRRLYNSEVNSFNTEIFTWPKSVIASSMQLTTLPLFQASALDRQDVEIKF